MSADRPDTGFLDALDVAAAELSEEERTRYQSLACFPQEAMIPAATISRLWGCGEPALGAQIRRFAELGLAALRVDGLSFSGVQRDYLVMRAEPVAAAHEQLLAAHRPTPDGDWYRLDPADPYLWNHLAHHLSAAGRDQELIATVTDPAWLAVRIARDGSSSVQRDLTEALRSEPGQPFLMALLRRLQQISNLLDRVIDVDAVAGTLATRDGSCTRSGAGRSGPGPADHPRCHSGDRALFSSLPMSGRPSGRPALNGPRMIAGLRSLG